VQEDALSTTLSTGYTGSGEGTKSTTGTISYANLLTLLTVGADENAIFSLNSAITPTTVQTTGGSDVYSKGSLVSYSYNAASGQIQGISADNRVVFTLTQSGGTSTPTDPTDDTFTYELKDQLDHPAPVSGDAGDAQTLALNLSPAIKATDRDLDVISLSTSLSVVVEDDVPVLSGSSFSIAVQEDALSTTLSTGYTGSGEGTKSTTGTISYANLLTLLTVGADENAIFSLNSAITPTTVQTTGGSDVYSKGSLVSYSYNAASGQIQGISADNRVVFTLTQSGGTSTPTDPTDDTFTYELKDQLDHPAPVSGDAGDAQTLALNLSPAIKATDRDLDVISLSTSLSVVVEDDVPVAAFYDDIIVVEGGATAFLADPIYGGIAGEFLSTSYSPDYNLLYNDFLGADETTSKEITSFQYITASGALSSIFTSGTSAKTLYGTLKVNSDGSWDYITDASVTHLNTSGNAVSSLTDKFIYTIKDYDGDTASAQQNVIVHDTEPYYTSPLPAAYPTISDGSPAGSTLTDSLYIQVNVDGIADVYFTNSNEPPFSGINTLKSEGSTVLYVLADNAHTLYAHNSNGAYTAGDTSTVFKITIDNPTSQVNNGAGYTFTLYKPIDHDSTLGFVTDSNNDGIKEITFPFTVYVEDGDGDITALPISPAASFQVVVTEGSVSAGNDTLIYDQAGDIAGTKTFNGQGGARDTLLLPAGDTLDFTRTDISISNIEIIDLTAFGNHLISSLTLADVTAMGVTTLYILGDSGDTVNGTGWTFGSTSSSTLGSSSHTFDTYTSGGTTLKIENVITHPGVTA